MAAPRVRVEHWLVGALLGLAWFNAAVIWMGS